MYVNLHFLSPPANLQASGFHVNINIQFFFITCGDEKLGLGFQYFMLLFSEFYLKKFLETFVE